MLVELDIFSGRPNPVWQLDAGEAETVNALLAGLPEPVPGSRTTGEPLGYRGFRITDSARGHTITVRGTTVEIHSAGTVSSATDVQARLERALAETARSHLDRDTYEFLRSQLNS